MKRGNGLKRRQRRRSALEQAASARFRELVLVYPCLYIFEGCSGPMDPHHLIPKQFLKTHFCTLPEAEKWALVYAPQIGVPLCRKHHDQVEGRVARVITASEVPSSAWSWAEEWGIDWKLRLCCPAETDRRSANA